MITVKNLKKHFGGADVLAGIDVTINKGDVICVIGPSGSGKSTFLRCLNLLETPTGGSIIFEGNELTGKKVNLNLHRQKMGMVFQQFNLFPQYNVKDNLTLAPRLALKGEIKAMKKAKKDIPSDYKSNRLKEIDDNADELLERVGLTDKAEAYPCELSGGQQQRVAIARALAMQPDILCFDEPTSALDPELTGEVLNVIRSLKTGNSTMIVVTHEMEFARGVADKVIFMANGVIEEYGTPDEVFGNPKSEILKSFLSKALDA